MVDHVPRRAFSYGDAPIMIQTLDQLFSEAASAKLMIQILERQHWRATGDPQWVCWLRSLDHYDLAAKGEGFTPHQALNAALNEALSYHPEPVIVNSNFDTGKTSLDGLLPALPTKPVKIIPGAVRRL